MHINQALRALREDPLAQRQAQIAMELAATSWRDAEGLREIEQELARFSSGAELATCKRIAHLMSDHSTARAFAGGLCEGMSAALARHPLGHVPFRHQSGAGTAMLQIAQSGSAVLVLVNYDEAAAAPLPTTASFSDVERHEMVLAGAADLRIATILEESCDRAAIDCEPCRIVEGETLYLTPDIARIAERIHGHMTILRVARSPARPKPSRVFSLADGALVHRAAGDRGESRREMAMAVLGRMGRIDAAPVLAELTREGSDNARWQALRECLALDTATGFAALTKISIDLEDALAAQAGALRAQLLEAYPQLAEIDGREPCPA